MKNTCKTHGIWSMVDYMKVHGGCVEYKRWKKGGNWVGHISSTNWFVK
jgi:hypothetical protein